MIIFEKEHTAKLKKLIKFLILAGISSFALVCVLICLFTPLRKEVVTEYVFDRSTISSEQVVYEGTKAWNYHVKALNKTTNEYEWLEITADFIDSKGLTRTNRVANENKGMWALGAIVLFFLFCYAVLYCVCWVFEND